MTSIALTTDLSYRYCSRCKDTLTDPVSREHGIGPICRGKTNSLYAKTIPANYALAMVHAITITEEMIHPESLSIWQETYSKLSRRCEKANQTNNDIHTLNLSGQDLREIIKNLDFLCSYKHPSFNTKDNLIKIVHYLGYIGLAGILSGLSSTGKAKIWFENGRIYFQGSYNKNGYRKVKTINGYIVPQYRGDKTPFSVPYNKFEEFKNVVMTYYPMVELEDLTNIEQECAKYTPKEKEVSIEKETKIPIVPTINIGTEFFTLFFPWKENIDMYQLINDIKINTNRKERSYNPNTKIWAFRKENLQIVSNIIKKYFTEFNIIGK